MNHFFAATLFAAALLPATSGAASQVVPAAPLPFEGVNLRMTVDDCVFDPSTVFVTTVPAGIEVRLRNRNCFAPGQTKVVDVRLGAYPVGAYTVRVVSLSGDTVGVLETVGGALLMLGVVPRMMSVLFVVDMIGAAAFAGGTDGPAYVVLPAILGTATAAYAAWGAGAWQWYPDHLLIARVRRRDPEVWISSGLLAGVVLT